MPRKRICAGLLHTSHDRTIVWTNADAKLDHNYNESPNVLDSYAYFKCVVLHLIQSAASVLGLWRSTYSKKVYIHLSNMTPPPLSPVGDISCVILPMHTYRRYTRPWDHHRRSAEPIPWKSGWNRRRASGERGNECATYYKTHPRNLSSPMMGRILFINNASRKIVKSSTSSSTFSAVSRGTFRN